MDGDDELHGEEHHRRTLAAANEDDSEETESEDSEQEVEKTSIRPLGFPLAGVEGSNWTRDNLAGSIVARLPKPNLAKGSSKFPSIRHSGRSTQGKRPLLADYVLIPTGGPVRQYRKRPLTSSSPRSSRPLLSHPSRPSQLSSIVVSSGSSSSRNDGTQISYAEGWEELEVELGIVSLRVFHL